MNRKKNIPPRQIPRENERKPERKSRHSKTIAVFILAVSLVISALLLSGLVPLNQIEVENNKRYNAEEIQKASGLVLGKNTFNSKLRGAESNITRELPYIQSAEIKRKAGGVIISVTECSAKYALKQGGKYLLLSDSMKVLEIGADKVPNGAVKVSGLEPIGVSLGQTLEAKNKTGAELLNKTVSLLSEFKVKDITEINISDVNNIELWYQNRLQLIMGSEEELEYNLRFAKETIKRENDIDPNQSGRFDFSEHGKAHFTPYIPTTIPVTVPPEPTTQAPATVSPPASTVSAAPTE